MEKTYHNVHWARPHAQLAVRLDILVGRGFVLDSRNLLKLASITRSTANVLQAENHSDHLDDGHERHLITRTSVESISLKVVQLLGPSWVNSGRIGELSGLEKEMSDE